MLLNGKHNINKALFSTAALLVGVLFATASLAVDPNSGQPGDWLARYTTARAAGLGGSYVSEANGAMGPVWNPAGLTTLMQNEAHFDNASLFEDTRVTGFSFALPARTLPSVGITILQLSSGDFERTNELNDNLGTFNESDLAFLVTASKRIHPRISLGTNLKIVRQSVEEFSDGGFGMDFGVLADVSQSLRVGASVLNVGGPSINMRESDESFPVQMRAGFSFRGFGGRAMFTSEIDHRSGPGAFLRTGGEAWVTEALALRVGYAETNIGGGFSYKFANGLQFDYGAADHDLGVVHRFGFSFRFGGFFASSQASPAIFSPTGDNAVTKFSLKARTRGDAERWALDIYDKHDEIVRRFGGKGTPPAHVVWDGTGETGMPLADGVYRYVLTVYDSEGNELSARERNVEIATSGPQGSVPVEVQ
ncbi:MAG: PorV/PorQ family protein [Deltaproteobacteria bacterium]|jgi:hypothetical protein|nr:PorV/PorQ family protein [Deltaproteobacteria bacterium]